MSLSHIEHITTVPNGSGYLLTGVTDILVVETTSGMMAYAVSQADSCMVTAFQVEADGSYTQVDSVEISADPMPGVTAQLEALGGPANMTLAVSGLSGSDYYTVDTDATGGFATTGTLANFGTGACISSSQCVEVDGQAFLLSSLSGSGDFNIWQLGENGQAALTQQGNADDVSVVGVTDFAVIEAGNQTLLLSANGDQNALTCYQLSGNGTAQQVGLLSSGEGGLWINNPSQIESVTLGQSQFVVVASSGSSSLSVVEVSSAGGMTVTDHMLDTQDTRFAGARILETITYQGRVIVVAAGNDDGFSVLELTADGLLQHLTSVEDATNTTLDAVSAISLAVQGESLLISVTSGSEAGLSVFGLDLSGLVPTLTGSGLADTLTGGSGDDQLLGGFGDDSLIGGAGDDMLIGGSGDDTLHGGAGADVFILDHSAGSDLIDDFNFHEDTIDLSRWPFLRSVDQLEFSFSSGSFTVSYLEESLTVQTVSGASVTSETLGLLDLIGADRFLTTWALPEPEPEPEPETDLHLLGTSQSDALSGDIGDDTLQGFEQGDVLRGYGGRDSLSGGAGNDTLFGNAHSDILNGGTGHDLLYGGKGFDTIQGASGNDTIVGSDGYDQLFGGTGEDVLTGNNGADTIKGEAGHDHLTGGLNGDKLFGGAGNDTLYGSAGFDSLSGNDGDDELFGNAGVDYLLGGEGNDMLDGGINHDHLDGGQGNDSLYGNNGNDRLNGGTGNDLLLGNSGHDTLDGGAGDDILHGNFGYDVLDGGAGDDILFGGIGVDVFVFSEGNDTIADYVSVDSLQLNTGLWGGGVLTLAELSGYSNVSQDGLLFDFGPMNTLFVEGVNSLTELFSNIEFA